VSEDKEFVIKFSTDCLELNEEKGREFVSAWQQIAVGYSMLSLKAINNILVFLRKGYIYSDAVILAKIPDILGQELWNKKRELLIENIKNIIRKNKECKSIINITNGLIQKKAFNGKPTNYIRSNSDCSSDDIKSAVINHFGKETWKKVEKDTKNRILEGVIELYGISFQNDKNCTIINKNKFNVINYKNRILYQYSSNYFYELPRHCYVKNPVNNKKHYLLSQPNYTIYY